MTSANFADYSSADLFAELEDRAKDGDVVAQIAVQPPGPTTPPCRYTDTITSANITDVLHIAIVCGVSKAPRRREIFDAARREIYRLRNQQPPETTRENLAVE